MKVKNRKQAQPPPEFPTSDAGDWATDKDQEPSLHDVMAMFGNINTRLTAVKERVHLDSSSAAMASAQDVQPHSRRGRPTYAGFNH